MSKPSREELDRGIPLLIDQLMEALRARPIDDSAIVDAAARYARRLFALGFTVSEVVHGYVVLCEVVTSLGAERDVWFDARDFEIFNRVLDVAIAGAVTEYEKQRCDAAAARELEDIGVLAHALRNALTGGADGVRDDPTGIGGRGRPHGGGGRAQPAADGLGAASSPATTSRSRSRTSAAGCPTAAPTTLFPPFVRRASRSPGVGLGLSIVARAAQALRGEVRVRDLPGKECVFTLDLPGVVEMQPQPATA